ncbi:MAG: helix-turn-helix transcriptional regulator, partial [Cyclobacteriaceae bacterium]|nr:helix-turn-helix transcriptional regulator [Cyclobacteriaceae bacterium]
MRYEEKYLKYKGRIVFGKQSMPYFNRLPKEYFEDEACFVFVNKGEISVRSQTDYMDLTNNNAVLAKCLNYFFETNEKQRTSGDGVEVIAVILYPALVEELFEFDLSKSDFSFNYNIKKIEVDRLLANFKESINILLDNPDLADESIIKTKLKEFVLLMAKSQEAPSQLDFLSAIFKPLEIQFKTTILQNIYSNLSIDELARLCHLSPSSFKRKFKESFNTSPKKYISKKKVEKAASLLKTADSRVSDIAYDVGFDSLATFSRNFIAIYGKSPSAYRLS